MRIRVAVLTLALLFAATPLAAAGPCPSVNERAELATAANRLVGSSQLLRNERWRALITAQQRCGDVEAEATALAAWSSQAMAFNARDDALAAETARHALAARAGLESHRAAAALHIGILLTERGELDLAERRLREASAAFESLGAWAEAADAQSRLARHQRIRGDYLAALGDERSALSLRRRMDPPPNVWRSLLNLAVLYEQLDMRDDARRRYGEALDEAEREGNAENVAIVLGGFAGFLNDFGGADATQALAMAERALATQRQHGRVVRTSAALLQVGRAHMNLAHLDQAEVAFAEALELAQQRDHAVMAAHVELRMAELALLRGQLTQALALLEQARSAYENKGNRHRLAKVYSVLEAVYEQQGDDLNAARAGRERFRLRDELLGARATDKLGELLSRFELSEERLRNERLEGEKTVTELTLVAERRRLQSIYVVVAGIALVLLLLAWRHLTARRLYRLLHQQNQLLLQQSNELHNANGQLQEQSERLYKASITDALTGVHNRAHGMRRLDDILSPSRPSDASPATILIDIDHFKAINDGHGHPVGDQVLIAISQQLQLALPADAELSRIGGEEFMVLLPDASPDRALDVGESLRKSVHDRRLEVPAGELRVTISAGVCSVLHLREITPQRAYAAADEALYRAKHSGRDRVCAYAA